jgi:hypothetical protein
MQGRSALTSPTSRPAAVVFEPSNVAAVLAAFKFYAVGDRRRGGERCSGVRSSWAGRVAGRDARGTQLIARMRIRVPRGQSKCVFSVAGKLGMLELGHTDEPQTLDGPVGDGPQPQGGRRSRC